MNEDERKILFEIDNLQTELLREAVGNNSNGYSYKRNADLLFNKVLELHNNHNPEYLTLQSVSSLEQTTREDVSRVVGRYEELQRNSTSHKNKSELLKKMDSTNSQISSDIFPVFQKIRNIKEEQ